ncbi:hypothetical protein GCM10027456_78690 [Kineosporia babensis]
MGPPQLLGVDWRQPAGTDPYTQYYFTGPRLDAARVQPQLSVEHDQWQMTSAKEWPDLVGQAQAVTFSRLLNALQHGTCFYLRNNQTVPAR